MLAKEFFRQVQLAEKELKVIDAKLRHFREIGFSIGGSAGVIGNKHRGTSRVELAACGAVDALRDIQSAREGYLALLKRAEGIIKKIPQEKYRQILNYRYLCGWSFRSISDEIGYRDPNSVYRSHGWALAEAQKILNEEEDKNDA